MEGEKEGGLRWADEVEEDVQKLAPELGGSLCKTEKNGGDDWRSEDPNRDLEPAMMMIIP